jgi:hypothetical protein
LGFLRVESFNYETGHSFRLIEELHSSVTLQVLQFSIIFTTDGTKIPESLSFPNVHTLGLKFIDLKYGAISAARIANWEFPALLFAQLHFSNHSSHKQLKEVIASHGPKLTSIQIDNMSALALTLIAKHCPILEDLIVQNYHSPEEPPSQFTFPRLRRICHRMPDFTDGLGHFLHQILSMRRPLLQRVQVLQTNGGFISVDISQVKKWMDIWGNETVSLEDGEGKKLDVLLKELLSMKTQG